MTDSVSFDRAAEYYDRTRTLQARLIPNLGRLLPQDGRCLEIGVGTGRIALPLVEEGFRVVGVDISREMLKKLLGKRRTSWPEVAVADATKLPFADRSFTSAIAAHVLHLIPDWTSAVGEMLRVLELGGVLVAMRGGDTKPGWHREVRSHFFKEAGAPPWPPGLDKIEELDAHMRRIGVEVDPLPELVTEDSLSVSELLAILEAGYWSACWGIDGETRTRAASATRDWAREQFGELDVKRDAIETTHWHAYRSGQQRKHVLE